MSPRTRLRMACISRALILCSCLLVVSLIARQYVVDAQPIPQQKSSASDVGGNPLPNQTPQAFLPVINNAAPATPSPIPSPTRSAPATPIATPSLGVSRSEAVDLYRGLFLPPRDAPAGFTGDVDGCIAGTVSSGRIQALTNQLNYYRRMAGVPDTAALDAMNHYAQAAAALMGANGKLDHFPTADWKCFSADGALGASRSNLGLSMLHPNVEWGKDDWILGEATTFVEGMIHDFGPPNYKVGHRNWLLSPVQTRVGIGEVRYHKPWEWDGKVWTFEYFAGAINTLNPDDDRYWENWPSIRDGFLAWPPAGYVPYQVVYPRWSLHFPPQYSNGFGVEVHLQQASIQMWMDGIEVPLTYAHKGEEIQTLVWEPAIDWENLDWSVERFVQVNVRGIDTEIRDWREIVYSLVLFDPDNGGELNE